MTMTLPAVPNIAKPIPICQVDTESLRRSHNPRGSCRPPGDRHGYHSSLIDSMVKSFRHGHKLRIKGHRGLLLMKNLHELAPSHAKEPAKESVYTIFRSQAAETWWTWHQQTWEQNMTSSSTSVLSLNYYHNYSCCPSYTKANHRPHLFLHRAQQPNQKHNDSLYSILCSTCCRLNLLDPLSGGFFHE